MYVLPDDDRSVERWHSRPVAREAGKNAADLGTGKLVDTIWCWLAGEAQTEIAERLGVSSSRIHQILKNAPQKLCARAGVRNDDGYDIILEAFPLGELVHTIAGGVYLRLRGSPSTRILTLREPTR